MDTTTSISLTPQLTKEQQDIFNEEVVALSRETTTLLIRFGDHPTEAPLTELQHLITSHEEATKQEKTHFEEQLPENWQKARQLYREAITELSQTDEEFVTIKGEDGAAHTITRDSRKQIHNYLYPFDEPDIPFQEIKSAIEKVLRKETLTEKEQELLLNYIGGLQGLFTNRQEILAILEAFSEKIQTLPTTPQT